MRCHITRWLAHWTVRIHQALYTQRLGRICHVDVALRSRSLTVRIRCARHTEVLHRHRIDRLTELVGSVAVRVHQTRGADILVLVCCIYVTLGSARVCAVRIGQTCCAGILLGICIDVTHRTRSLALQVGRALHAVVLGVIHTWIFVASRRRRWTVGIRQTDETHVLAGIRRILLARRSRHRTVRSSYARNTLILGRVRRVYVARRLSCNARAVWVSLARDALMRHQIADWLARDTRAVCAAQARDTQVLRRVSAHILEALGSRVRTVRIPQTRHTLVLGCIADRTRSQRLTVIAGQTLHTHVERRVRVRLALRRRHVLAVRSDQARNALVDRGVTSGLARRGAVTVLRTLHTHVLAAVCWIDFAARCRRSLAVHVAQADCALSGSGIASRTSREG